MRILAVLGLGQFCLFLPVAVHGEAPRKVVKTVFQSTFDTPQLGQSPGIVVNTTFDGDKIGQVPGEKLVECGFEEAPASDPPKVVVTSFETGISPEVFQWGEESAFQLREGGRNSNKAVGVEAPNALLQTHLLPSEPGAWYEMSVWCRGEGRVRVRAFDGVQWLDSVAPPGRDGEWQLARVTFQAKPAPEIPKGAKIAAVPQPRLAAAFGLQGPGKALFDDFKIVRLPLSSPSAGVPESKNLWMAHEMEFGKGLNGTKAARIRNGLSLSSHRIAVKPDDALLVRFYYRGLGSAPPAQVTHSACAGRFYVDAVAGTPEPRYWGFPVNLLLSELGTEDRDWRLVSVPIRVPAQLWGQPPTAIVLDFCSYVPQREGFDYDQVGDAVIDDLAVFRGQTEPAEGMKGDEFWELPDPTRATVLGPSRGVELVRGQGIGKTAAVRVAKGGQLTSWPLGVSAGECLELSWYYKCVKSEANRAELSKGTRGCGRAAITVGYENKTQRDTGVWTPMALTEPDKPDTEWKYCRMCYRPAADGGLGQPKAVAVSVYPEVTLGFSMRGELLLDNFAVRRSTAMETGTAADSLWLGVPDPAVTTDATGPDCSLKLVDKEGVKRSRAVRLDGRYAIQSLLIPVEAEKNYLLSLQHKILRAEEWPGVGLVGGYVELYWDDKDLVERFNLTYLMPGTQGQPDKEWRTQEVPFTVPRELRNKAVPKTIRAHLTGYGTILYDEARLDQVE